MYDSPLGVDDVVEEGAEGGGREVGGGVGDPLHHRAKVELGADGAADVVERLDDAGLLPQPLLRLALPVEQVLVEPPRDEAGDADAGDEEGVDGGPLPGVVQGRGVVEDRARIDGPEDAVVHEHVGDGGEEADPVLVEGDDGDHDEEEEVHLDDAAREVHQHRRARQQAERGGHAALPAAERRRRGEQGEDGADGRLEDRVGQRRIPRATANTGMIAASDPEEHEDPPVAPGPELLRQGPALGQRVPNAGCSRPATRPSRSRMVTRKSAENRWTEPGAREWRP